jgi:hypothetical protein
MQNYIIIKKKGSKKKMTQKYFSFSLIVEVERKKKWL